MYSSAGDEIFSRLIVSFKVGSPYCRPKGWHRSLSYLPLCGGKYGVDIMSSLDHLILEGEVETYRLRSVGCVL